MKLRHLIVAALLLLSGAPALAQSGCGSIVYSAILTAGQWNACFIGKQNVLGFSPLNKAGDTMSGPLILAVASGAAALNIPATVTDPVALVNGDIWITTKGFSFKVNGAIVGPSNTAHYSGSSAPSAPATYSLWTDTTAALAPINIYDGAQWVTIGTLDTTLHAWRPAEGWRVIAKSAVQVSHTGDTSEFTLATISLPAGAMGPNGTVRVTANFGATGTANTKTMRVKFGGTAYVDVAAAASTLSAAFQRLISNRNSASSQVGSPAAQTTLGTSTTAPLTSAVNTASAVTILITGQLADAGDAVSIQSYVVEVNYGG